MAGVGDRRHASRSLYNVGIDGGGLRRLTRGSDASQPEFALDGSRIVFVGRV